MANTPNFNLYKPSRADTNVEVDTSLSDNFTKIDTELQNNKGGLEGHISNPNAHTSENVSHADGSVKTTLDNHEERIVGLETDTEGLEVRVNDIETLGLDVLAPNLEGRIQTIESDVEGILAPTTFDAMDQQSYTFDEYRIGYVDNKLTEIVTNVKLLGAKGDGTTDDTTAIQNALNTLPVNSILFFPKGTYKVTSQLTWDGTISLMGFNRENTIIKASGTFGTLLAKKDEAMGLCGYITGLTFDGNGTVDYTFDFPRGKGVKVYRNFFKNAKLRTVRFGASVTWGAYEVHFFDNNVFGLESYVGVSANRPDYALEIAGNCSDSAFYDNILTNSKIAGILSNGTHNDVNNNHIYGYPNDYIMQYCISVTNKTNNTFHNRCDTPNEAGIFVSQWGNRIEGNMVFWNGTMTDLTGKVGIKIDNTSNILTSLNVSNNFVEGQSPAQPPKDITIVGNLPDHSVFRGNYGNMIRKFEDNYRGQLNVATGATSSSVTFDVPFAYYNYSVNVSTNWYTKVRTFRSLTGITIQYETAPTVNSEAYYTIERW